MIITQHKILPGIILPALERDLLHNTLPLKLALAASACAAGRLVNSKYHRVERNGGSFQRQKSAMCSQTLSTLPPANTARARSCSCARSRRTPACLRARPFTHVRLIHERIRCCKRSFLTPVSLVYSRNSKLSKEYKHFEPSDPFEPLNGKNIAISKPDSIPLPL